MLRNYSLREKEKNPPLCKAQHEWESCHWTVCPCSILASYNFLHNCLNVLVLIPVAPPTLCYFLKKASKLRVSFNRELHRGQMPGCFICLDLPQHRGGQSCSQNRSPPASAASGDLSSLPAASRPGMWKFLLCLCHSSPKYHITKNIKIKLLITFSWMPSGPHWKLTLSVKLKITTFVCVNVCHNGFHFNAPITFMTFFQPSGTNDFHYYLCSSLIIRLSPLSLHTLLHNPLTCIHALWYEANVPWLPISENTMINYSC